MSMLRSVFVVVLVVLAACQTDTASPRDDGVLSVPSEYPSIGDAVNAAQEGDMILIDSGTYHESVTVETARLTIRGVDRNAVVVDGEYARENGFAVFSNGVAIENLTVRHFNGNGVFFSGDYQNSSGRVLTGYAARYLTVANNGTYGVYAFGAVDGVVEQVYGSGHGDAAVYVGQCDPCRALVIDSVGEKNAIGVQTANASVGIMIARSTWSHNRMGVNLATTQRERNAPQRGAVVVGNRIESNGDPLAVKADLGGGFGVAISGGTEDTILRNRIVDHPNAAVLLTGGDGFAPSGIRIEANMVSGTPRGLVIANNDGVLCSQSDLSVWPAEFTAAVHACDGSVVRTNGGLPPDTLRMSGVGFKEVPPPGPQAQMPEAVTAGPTDVGAVVVFPTVDSIGLPV
jgi:hypothetical protein